MWCQGLGTHLPGATVRSPSPCLAAPWCSASFSCTIATTVWVSSVLVTLSIFSCTWALMLFTKATISSELFTPANMKKLEINAMFTKSSLSFSFIGGVNDPNLPLLCSYLPPLLGQRSSFPLPRVGDRLLPYFLDPLVGGAVLHRTSVYVHWGQGQVAIMAPTPLSSLVFDTEDDKLLVLDLRSKLKGTKSAVSHYIGKTTQDVPKFIPTIREFTAQCSATSNAFFKRQALLECKTAENMLDGLRNRIIHQTTEILSYLEGITNQDNTAGKVQECIEQTQLAQDSYLERLKAAVNRLAVVQLEAESLLAPAAPPTGDGDAPQQADAPLARYDGSPKYVSREGSPGTLEESISPAELESWVSRYLDWQHASWVGGPPSQKALVTQAKLLLSQAWLDKLEDRFDWATLQFADLVRALEKCLNVQYPMIKRRVSYLSQIKVLRVGEGLAGMYRRYLKDQKVGGMGTENDFKLTWHTLHHTMVVASMPPAAQQELFRTFKSYDFTSNDLLEFCETYDSSLTAISSSGRSAKVNALTSENINNKCSNCGSLSHKAHQCPSPPVLCTYCKGTRHTADYCWRNQNGKNWQPHRVTNVRRQDKKKKKATVRQVAAIEAPAPALGASPQPGAAQPPSPQTPASQPRQTGPHPLAPITATVNHMSLSRNTLHGATPRLQVGLHSGGEHHMVDLMPDSGAECSITDITMVLKWGLPMVHVDPADYRVTTVTGEAISIIGTSAITINTGVQGGYILNFLVAEETGIGEIIVGWGDLLHMNLFPLSHTTFLGSASQADLSVSPHVPSTACTGTVSAIQSSSQAFLDKVKNNPPTRSYTEVPPNHPNYDAEMEKIGQQMAADLIADYPPAFGDHLEPGVTVDHPPMRIRINEDATPVNVTVARDYPPGRREACLQLEKEMEDAGISQRWDKPTTFCSRAFFIPKKESSLVRLIVDYRALNACSTRVGYPFSSSESIFRTIPESALVFLSFDLLMSYWQLQVHEDDIGYLAYLLPSGKWTLTRGPMGWLGSGDELNISSRCLLLGLESAKKILDDILLHASSLKEAYLLGSRLMMNAIMKGWIFSTRKARISNKVVFCGLSLEADKDRQVSILPEINRIQALTELPSPTTRKDAQSLIGILVSFSKWVPGMSKLMRNMKMATMPGTHFCWTSEMEDELVNIRQIVSNLLPLRPFNAQHNTFIYVDASYLGFGCVLMQEDSQGVSHFVMAASSGITPAMTRYSVYELELSALCWALEKNSYYLSGGCRPVVLTDHRALVGIETKSLEPAMSPRVWRLLEKVVRFDIIVKHVSHKENVVADYLSRTTALHRSVDVQDEPRHHKHSTVHQGTVNLITGGGVLDPKLLELIDIAEGDEDYQSILAAVSNGDRLGDLHQQHPARQVAKVYGRLEPFEAPNGRILLVDGARVFVPQEARNQVLEQLHTFHTGASTMQATASLTCYWPNIAQDISNFVANCRVCAVYHRHHLPFPPKIGRAHV